LPDRGSVHTRIFFPVGPDYSGTFAGRFSQGELAIREKPAPACGEAEKNYFVDNFQQYKSQARVSGWLLSEGFF
jgi:hypothetical protein